METYRNRSRTSRISTSCAQMGALSTAVVLVLLLIVPSAYALPGPDRSRSASPLPQVTSNISYVSTVDGWALSYLETLPTGFSNATPAPVVIYLHGLGTVTTNVSGGTGGNTQPGNLLVNASSNGYIVESINTRSSAGYYANTPCGGPQETDIVNAVASINARHPISGVYFVGFSGGSAGAFELVGNGLVTAKGIATSGTITDFPETWAYNINRNDLGHYNAFVADMCGSAPSPTNHTAAGKGYYLSPFRWYPANFSQVRLFLAAGGLDTQAPSNYSSWAYSNVNSTVSLRTCVVASALGEPAGCTTPYINLTGTKSWLELYESKATHANTQISYSALFQFWGNATASKVRAGGFYSSIFPPATSASTLVPKQYAWEGFPTVVNHLMGCGSATGATAAIVAVPTGAAIYYMVALVQGTAITVSTATDTAGDTFAKIKTVTSATFAHVELWVVNSSAGNAANRITGTWSATDRFCFWEVVVSGQRSYASYQALGAGSTGNNVTVSDGLTTTVPRGILLTIAQLPIVSTYVTIGSGRVWDQQNSSTTISAMGSIVNLTTATNFLPQSTVSSGHWAALSVAIQAPAVPSAPTGLIAVNTTTSSIALSWVNPPGPLLNSSLLRGTTCGIWVAHTTLFGVVSGTIVYGLPAGTLQCFAVLAWNATGPSTASATLNVSTNATASNGGGGSGGGPGGQIIVTDGGSSTALTLVLLGGLVTEIFVAGALIARGVRGRIG